jgi:hypothetical protein
LENNHQTEVPKNQQISSYILEKHLYQGERTTAPLGKEINIFNTSSARRKLSNKEGRTNISCSDQETPLGKDCWQSYRG